MPIDFDTDLSKTSEQGVEVGKVDFESDLPVVEHMPDNAASNAAAMTAFMSGGFDEDYFYVKQDLMGRGHSAAMQNILRSDNLERQEELTEAVEQILVDPTLSDEDKVASIQSYATIAKKDASIPVFKRMEEAAAAASEAFGAIDEQQVSGILDSIDELKKTDDYIRDYIAPQALDLSDEDMGSYLDAFGGTLIENIPRNQASMIIGLAEHMGKDPSWLDRRTVGNVLAGLRDDLRNTTEPEARIAMAKKYVDYIRKNAGLFGDFQGYEGWTTISQLVDTSKTDEDFDWDAAWAKVVGVFDYSVIGGTILRGYRKIGSVLGIVNRSDPDMARRVAAASLDSNSDETAKALGATREEILTESNFPIHSSNDKVITGAPDDVVSALAQLREATADIFNSNTKSIPSISRVLRDVVENNSAGRQHINKSTTPTPREDGLWESTVRVGKDEVRGYHSVKAAEAAARRRHPEKEFKILKRTPSGNYTEYVPRKDGKPEKSKDFLYEYNEVFEYRQDPYVDMTKLEVPKLSLTGKRARFFADLHSMFRGDLKSAGRIQGISDLESSVTYQIKRLGASFARLDNVSQERVMGLMQQESKRGKRFTYDELFSGDNVRNEVTKEEFIALDSLRNISDLNFATYNHASRVDMDNRGVRALQIAGEEVLDYGVPVNLSKGNISRTMDEIGSAISAATGEVMTLTREQLARVANKQAVLVKLESPIRRGESGLQEFGYAYVEAGNIGRLKKDLPQQVMPYIEGYVYRRHKDNFFVEKIDPRVVVDGKVASQRISVQAAARIESEAMTIRERLRTDLTKEELDAGVRYEVRESREHLSDLAGDASYENAKALGLFHRGKRGPLLDKFDGAEDNLISVAEAMQHSILSAARELSTAPILKQMMDDYVNTFGDLIRRNNENAIAYPTSADDILTASRKEGATPVETRARRRQAVAMWRGIEFLSGMSDPASKVQRQWIHRLVSYFDQIGRPGVAKTIDKWAPRKSVQEMANSAAFAGFLATNPTRQIALQASQHLLIAPLAPKHVGSGQAYKETFALMYGASLREGGNVDKLQGMLPTLAKASNMTEKEFLKDLDDWMKSGLPVSVDQNVMKGVLSFEKSSLVGEEGVKKMLLSGGNKLKAPVRFLQKYGFDKGEVFNLAMSRSIARHVLNKKGKAYTLEDLNHTARGYSLNMGLAGRFEYQDGMLRNMTQFFSFQHKALLALFGKNPVFDPEQLRRMWAVQIGLFGAEAAGVGFVVNGIINKYEDIVGEPVDPDTRELIVGGVGQYALNGMINAMEDSYGEKPTNLDWTAYAPGSGVGYMGATLFDLLFTGQRSLVETFGGASYNYFKRVGGGLTMAWDIMWYPDPNVDTSTRVRKALKHVLSGASSGASNFYKAWAMLESGKHVDSNGNPIVNVSDVEAWAMGLGGLQSQDVVNYYRIKSDGALLDRERNNEAKRITKLWDELYDSNKDKDPSLWIDQAAAISAVLGLSHDGEEAEIIQQKVFNIFKRRLRDGTAADSLIMFALKSMDVNQMTNYYSAIEQMPEGPKKDTLRALLDNAIKDGRPFAPDTGEE